MYTDSGRPGQVVVEDPESDGSAGLASWKRCRACGLILRV